MELRRLRYETTCSACGGYMPPGSQGTWDRKNKQARCAGCQPVERGVAGRSATREWQRRRAGREQRIRSEHQHLGGLILALTDDPQATASWGRGAKGEQLLGAALDGLRSERIAVLHDRRVPGTKANIDHLLISSSGVFVVDAKRYGGRVEKRDRGGFFRTDYRLYVADRDRSKLVAAMKRQVEAVRKALADGLVPKVVPVLCFVDSEWRILASPLRFGDVRVVWPNMLGKLVRTQGELTPSQIAALEQRLAVALPPA